MTGGGRVAAFVALLVVIFAAATIAGGILDPGAGDAADGAAGHGGHAAQASHHDEGEAGGGVPAGVAASQDGYRIVAERTRFAAGRSGTLRFAILDARGATVRTFQTEQARRLHLVVVRRDLRRFQHLHPSQGSDGAWSVRLTLPDAGVYRAFADFRTGGARHTLGVDLFVPGDFRPLDLPPAARTAHADGYSVLAESREPLVLTFSVVRRGLPITDLQPYLGAQGHLVMVRDGDLAYRHVHPLAEPGLAFHLGSSEPGTYRMFLQFRHRGRVHTVAFTRAFER
jgi:hypothetical protein